MSTQRFGTSVNSWRHFLGHVAFLQLQVGHLLSVPPRPHLAEHWPRDPEVECRRLRLVCFHALPLCLFVRHPIQYFSPAFSIETEAVVACASFSKRGFQREAGAIVCTMSRSMAQCLVCTISKRFPRVERRRRMCSQTREERLSIAARRRTYVWLSAKARLKSSSAPADERFGRCPVSAECSDESISQSRKVVWTRVGPPTKRFPGPRRRQSCTPGGRTAAREMRS